MSDFPVLRQIAIDTPDPRGLADFYRRLLGYEWKPGDEPGGPTDRAASDAGASVDWLVLVDAEGERRLAFQLVVDLPRPVWPDGSPPQMMHLDTVVTSPDELERQHARAIELGATDVMDQSDDPDELLYVLADPSGHPFCIYVADA